MTDPEPGGITLSDDDRRLLARWAADRPHPAGASASDRLLPSGSRTTRRTPLS
jgi:hypothetical protein